MHSKKLSMHLLVGVRHSIIRMYMYIMSLWSVTTCTTACSVPPCNSSTAVCVLMCVYVCVYMYVVCVRVHVCVRVYMCVCVSACVCACGCACGCRGRSMFYYSVHIQLILIQTKCPEQFCASIFCVCESEQSCKWYSILCNLSHLCVLSQIL